MNNPTWRQHYLPTVYLKQFSVDGIKASRRSKVWRLDKRINKLVSVEKQCYESFCYSKADPTKAERLFQNYEDIFGEVAQRVWKEERERHTLHHFGLIVFMISLHFRNPAYANRTDDERVAVYVDLEGEFLLQSLGVRVDPVTPTREHLELFQSVWNVRLMSVNEARLVTSDNPSQIYHVDGVPRLITMPIAPHRCAVAFDRRIFPTLGAQQLTKADLQRLNGLQVRCAKNAIFSAEQLTAEDGVEIREVWTKRVPPPGFVDAEHWHANYRSLEPFNFL